MRDKDLQLKVNIFVDKLYRLMYTIDTEPRAKGGNRG